MKPKRFQLCLERLEDRRLLAGNVTATVSAGNLVVSGDNLANRISIESAGENRIAVRGFNTQINGVPNAARVFSGVTGDISVQLRDGDDLVRVTNLIAPSNVLVSLGGGNDEVVTGQDKLNGDARFAGSPSGPLYVPGALRMYGGLGNDLVFQSDAHIDGLGMTHLGTGDDTLFMQRPAGSGQNVDYGGNLTILPDAGSDVVDLLGLVVDSDLTINDTSDALYLSIRSMDVHRNFRLTSAGLADSIDVSSTNVTRQFVLSSGGGSDRVRISAIASQLSANLGDGNDGFELVSSNIKSSAIYGGAGDDVFFARYAYGVDALFSGDAGRDVFRTSRSLPNHISSLRKQSIEVTETLV